MTDTHDGSHTWLKYVSRKKKMWDKALKDYYKEQERGRKFFEKPDRTTNEISKLKNKK